jgi:hypothetical protein
MPSKLSLYNSACVTFLGERKLSSLTENVVMRRRLDAAWDDDFLRGVLSSGLWNHAIRSVQLDYSPSVEPDFGYRRAFDKSSDWVRTAIVASDEYFKCALTQYSDEAGYLFADLDTIYVRFVSDDTDYGADLSLWPKKFTEFAACDLALKVAKATTGSDADVDALEKRRKRLLLAARSTDAMDEPTQFPPRGSWVTARTAGTRWRE